MDASVKEKTWGAHERLTIQRTDAPGVPKASTKSKRRARTRGLSLGDGPRTRHRRLPGTSAAPGTTSEQTVVGPRPFEFICADYEKPIVISGFEPLDVLQSVQMILKQLADGISDG